MKHAWFHALIFLLAMAAGIAIAHGQEMRSRVQAEDPFLPNHVRFLDPAEKDEFWAGFQVGYEAATHEWLFERDYLYAKLNASFSDVQSRENYLVWIRFAIYDHTAMLQTVSPVTALIEDECHTWPEGLVWVRGTVYDSDNCPHPVITGKCKDAPEIRGCHETLLLPGIPTFTPTGSIKWLSTAWSRITNISESPKPLYLVSDELDMPLQLLVPHGTVCTNKGEDMHDSDLVVCEVRK